MENQQSSAKSLMLNYGLALGIVSIIIGLINFSFGNIYDPHWAVSVIGIITMVVIIIFALKSYKTSNNGLLSLGTALKIGLGISLISAIIYIIYQFVFTSFIEPEFFKNMEAFQEQKMIDSNPNISDEQLEMQVSMMKKFMGMGVTAAMTFVASLFFGFLISLVGGLIMKKSEE